MEKLATALASDDLGSMIDVLLNDVNDEFITLAALGETQRSLKRAGARLTLLKVMSDHCAAIKPPTIDLTLVSNRLSPGRETNDFG
jgi:hypothetical protein